MAQAFDYPEGRLFRFGEPVPVFDHPVFAAMDPRTQSLLSSVGEIVAYEVGEAVATEQRVIFVQDGIIGHIPPRLSVCVGVSGAGSVFGLETALTDICPTPAVALARTTVLQAPSAALIEALGRDRLQALCILHAQARMSAVEDEAACNAAHLVPQRLAKWIRRLHLANRRRDVCLTQAELARLLGVQRSTVNLAIRQLQTDGAIRFVRGRIIVQCAERLQQAACGCPD